jgi:hypothetical protein
MSDEEARTRLPQTLQPVPAWSDRVRAHIPIEPASSLAADDAPDSKLWQIGRLVNASMLSAVDHLRCLRDSLDKSEWLYIMAYDSLVRSALVAASQAVWLLSGTRIQRRYRNLLIYRDEWRNEIASYGILEGSDLVEADVLRAETDKLKRRLEATSPTLRAYQKEIGPGTPGDFQMTRMVAEVADMVFPKKDGKQVGNISYGVRMSLSFTSAVVHAAPRAVMSRADRENAIDLGNGQKLMPISMSIPTLYQHTAGAVLILNEAWRLFDLRRIAQIG